MCGAIFVKCKPPKFFLKDRRGYAYVRKRNDHSLNDFFVSGNCAQHNEQRKNEGEERKDVKIKDGVREALEKLDVEIDERDRVERTERVLTDRGDASFVRARRMPHRKHAENSRNGKAQKETNSERRFHRAASVRQKQATRKY